LRIDHNTAAINQVLAQRNAPHPLVRSSVLRFVHQISPEAAMPLLVEALQDPDELVRMSAIDELDDADLQNLSKITQQRC
jgi:HEAT repeat protein